MTKSRRTESLADVPFTAAIAQELPIELIAAFFGPLYGDSPARRPVTLFSSSFAVRFFGSGTVEHLMLNAGAGLFPPTSRFFPINLKSFHAKYLVAKKHFWVIPS